VKIQPKVISLEGIDGSGKSSVANWLKHYLESINFDVVLLREPGSTPLGENLRALLLKESFRTASPWTDALLFYAARLENILRNMDKG
jgi:dTMP kinase